MEEIEQTDEAVAIGEPVFQVSMLSMMLKTMNTQWMRMVISPWISLTKRMLPLCNKINKIRKTEKNQYRSCQWVCGGTLSIKYWFSRVIE